MMSTADTGTSIFRPGAILLGYDRIKGTRVCSSYREDLYRR
jgi:hypothetical protein